MSDKQVQPEPDLNTKPKDIIGYCFGFACPDRHIQNTFDSITVDKYGEQRVCQTCGGISTPAIVKRIAEAQWEDVWFQIYYGEKTNYMWTNKNPPLYLDPTWTKYEFVRFLSNANPSEEIETGEKK